MKKINDIDINNKRVLIRADLNVPINNGIIQSDSRIIAALPTIKMAIKKNAKVIIMSHLGRPKEGQYEKKYSLFPVFQYLQKKLHNINMYFSDNHRIKNHINAGEILFLENVRFNVGELENKKSLSKEYSDMCDVFIMDAFGSAHRKQASTYGIVEFVKDACPGLLVTQEMKMLTKALKNPHRPLISIIGGSKVSTKFKILKKLAQLSDAVIIGGGIANTFLAIDYNIGKSLYEPNFVEHAKKLREKYNFIIPIDSRIGKKFCSSACPENKLPSNIAADEEIMDLGDKTIENAVKIIQQSKTIIWNGPVGVFEFKNFQKGTKVIAKTIANHNCFSIAGGGETLSVIDLFKIKEKISYISTGGGAFLEFIEGKELPAIHILKTHAKNHIFS